VRTPCVLSAEHVLARKGPPKFCARFGQLPEEVPSKHGPRTDHALITCAARGESDDWIFLRLEEAVRYALVDVQGTRVTSTGGESVARPQLERRESFACTRHATACLRAPKSVRRRY
jgi:hypothetical protein